MASATILGYGKMGREHVTAYEEAGIRDIQLCQTGRDWLKFTGQSDYLSVCSPDNCHAGQVIAGLVAGQQVFCEKPLCLTFDELEKIETVLQKYGGRLGVNYPLRYLYRSHPYKPADFVHMVYNWGRAYKMEDWRKEIPNYSPIMAGGCHMVDWFMWSTGLKITPVVTHRPKELVEVAEFYFEGGYGRLICDLSTSDGNHYQSVRTSGGYSWKNTYATDKKACLKAFIQGETDHELIIEGTRTCLEMLSV